MRMRSVSVLLTRLLASVAAAADGPVTVDNFPVITARIDGQDVPLMFDLGSDSSLALPEEALARIGTQSVTETRRWSDAKGNIIEAPMFRVPRIAVRTRYLGCCHADPGRRA